MEELFPFSLRDPPGDVPRKPIKKPQSEMRVWGASSERRRCLSARHWTSGAAFQAAPIALSFTSGVPTRWRGKNRLKSIEKS